MGGAAGTGALLGLETIAGVSVTPGERTGFGWSSDEPDSATIHLRSDAGDLLAPPEIVRLGCAVQVSESRHGCRR